MRRIYEARAYGPLPVEDCFWRTSLNGVASDPTAEGEIDCDYAVIGAGFTGLNAALGLAESGADVAVLEAEQPGWGASGRNGGFVCLGGDRLDQRSLVARFGAEDVALYRRAQLASVDLVADNLDRYGIDADRHSDGETLLAHKPRHAARLDAYAAEIETVFGVRPSVYRAGDLKDLGLGAHGTHGAMTTPVGFALNPGKYVAGLAAAARQAGARLFGRSPVTGVKHWNDIWELSTKQALIKAKYLILATNGYSSDDLPPWIAGRYLPVQSNIMVTRPLTADEIAEQGFSSTQMCYDSRNLLHYFRLLPDRRMLFGLRGGTSASAEAFEQSRIRARQDFDRMFPAWETVETAHFWSGLLCLSRRLTPFAGPLGDLPNAWGALAFHGNGVAMGSYAGRLIADRALGRSAVADRPHPAFMQLPPRRFGLGRHRRAILPILYRWFGLLDL